MRQPFLFISRSAVALLVVVLLAGGSHAREASQPSSEPAAESKGYLIEGERFGQAGAVVFDAVVLRPIAALTTGLGFALFVPAALLSWAEGADGRQEAWEHFVETPAKSVYERPLGDF